MRGLIYLAATTTIRFTDITITRYEKLFNLKLIEIIALAIF